LLRKSRGVLQVREREALEQKACGCYSVIAAAYRWATPPFPAALGHL
jgi:hypothetical protein